MSISQSIIDALPVFKANSQELEWLDSVKGMSQPYLCFRLDTLISNYYVRGESGSVKKLNKLAEKVAYSLGSNFSLNGLLWQKLGQGLITRKELEATEGHYCELRDVWINKLIAHNTGNQE